MHSYPVELAIPRTDCHGNGLQLLLQILDLLFSFPQPDRPHSNLLSGYFSKVSSCILLVSGNPCEESGFLPW